MAKRKAESELPRTLAEFEAWHAARPEKWEFLFGMPVMMAPASNRHSIIKGNIFGRLFARLERQPCRAFVDGPAVRSHDLYAIPDVVVTCSPVRDDLSTVDEPTVIVEVVSPSSERDDTNRKWRGYSAIPSLRHYLVVEQESRFVTVHTRTGEASFEERIYTGGAIELTAIGTILTLDEIYENVSFEPSATEEGEEASTKGVL